MPPRASGSGYPLQAPSNECGVGVYPDPDRYRDCREAFRFYPSRGDHEEKLQSNDTACQLKLLNLKLVYQPIICAMKRETDFLRIGVFYDGTFFTRAQNYFYGQGYGWLSFQELHKLLESYVRTKEQGFSSYKVVYSAWFQGLYKSNQATEDNLRLDRKRHHDLLHAGIEPKNIPMSETQGEKGIDVYMAVETLQIGLDKKIDLAILVTGDGDFVPLVRALMKNGVKVLVSYFKYEEENGHKSFANERLILSANYSLNINELENDKEFKAEFKSVFRKPEDFERQKRNKK